MTTEPTTSPMRTAILVSLLLHLALASLTWISVPDAPIAAPEPFDVTVMPAPRPETSDPSEPAAPQSKIVSPPDSPEAPPLREHPFLSDRDSRAEEETIARGDAGSPKEAENVAPETAKGSRAKPSRPEAPKPERSASSTKPGGQRGENPELFLDPSEWVDEENASGEGSAEELAARSRSFLEGLDPGTPEYLPTIREGKFTLLNTKADRFAPFVRRVGMRVFQEFSSLFRHRVLSGTAPRGRAQAQIEAVMSPTGDRIDVILRDGNGNVVAGRTLVESLHDRIFFDHNPPAGAEAEDGLIRFVFAVDARVWRGHPDQAGRVTPAASWILSAGLR